MYRHILKERQQMLEQAKKDAIAFDEQKQSAELQGDSLKSDKEAAIACVEQLNESVASSTESQRSGEESSENPADVSIYYGIFTPMGKETVRKLKKHPMAPLWFEHAALSDTASMKRIADIYPELLQLFLPDTGYTALHCAVENSSPEAIELLIGFYGVDPNVKSKDGSTALHVAAFTSRMPMFELLRNKYGASVTIKDKQGRTPLDYILHQKGSNRQRPLSESLKQLLTPDRRRVSQSDRSSSKRPRDCESRPGTPSPHKHSRLSGSMLSLRECSSRFNSLLDSASTALRRRSSTTFSGMLSRPSFGGITAISELTDPAGTTFDMAVPVRESTRLEAGGAVGGWGVGSPAGAAVGVGVGDPERLAGGFGDSSGAGGRDGQDGKDGGHGSGAAGGAGGKGASGADGGAGGRGGGGGGGRRGTGGAGGGGGARGEDGKDGGPGHGGSGGRGGEGGAGGASGAGRGGRGGGARRVVGVGFRAHPEDGEDGGAGRGGRGGQGGSRGRRRDTGGVPLKDKKDNETSERRSS